MKRSCIFTIIQLNHSIIHDIEHFITEGKSFMVYGTYHENNVPPPRLSPQWLCNNSSTWAHDVRLHIAGTNEPRSAQQAKQGV